MVRIEFICSFEKMEQEFISGEFIPEMMECKQKLSGFVMMALNDEQIKQLTKVSCCVYGKVDVPEWYMSCNGKLWYKHGYLEA